MTSRIIRYNFFHWGPLLYKTSLRKEEINLIKKLCSKKSEDKRKKLAGLIKHEHAVNVKKLFPIINPYLNSYAEVYFNYLGKPIGKKIELESAWVNYMTKFESNPLHTHTGDLSFVIYTKIPKTLKKEFDKNLANTSPGAIHFIYNLTLLKHNINQHNFFPKVGDFFIFPANLSHYVNHFKSEGERISVSGNLEINDV